MCYTARIIDTFRGLEMHIFLILQSLKLYLFICFISSVQPDDVSYVGRNM